MDQPNPSQPPPDLLSLVLSLRPLEQADPTAAVPAWWGRAAHALLLSTVRQADPTLAEALHEDNGLRPFTVSSLLGSFPQNRLDPGQVYRLRLTALRQDVATILAEAALRGPLAPGACLELDYLAFQVEAVTQDSTQHPWAASVVYHELGASLLLAKDPPARRVGLQFTSPTTFKSNGMHVPVPLPELVFGSLLERWNAFAPIAFPAETKRYAAECLAIGRYRLSSRAAPMKSGGLRVGGVGEISYTSLNYDRYWMSVIGVLAEFALFAGVGAGTGMGLGQCRKAAGTEERE